MWEALLGAIVGGAVVIVGSFAANRYQLTREQRIELYSQWVPRLLEHLRSHAIEPYVAEDAAEIKRRATIASGRDRRQALPIAEIAPRVLAARKGLDRETGSVRIDDTEAGRDFVDLVGQAEMLASAYENWLESQLQSPLAGWARDARSRLGRRRGA